MLNLALDWDLYLGSNPVRKVKFFQEMNLGFRTLSLEEGKKLLANATPYIHDVVDFAVNTGLRIGEILILTWDRVDLENNLLNVFANKTLAG
jgi:integrase